MKRKTIALTGAAITTAITAGTFVVFSLVYSPALSKLGNREYIERMQTINRDIQNPWFLGAFMGAVVLLPLAAYLYRKTDNGRTTKLLIAASLLYIVGTFGITSAVNVPLNEKLDKVSTVTTPADSLADTRRNYETTWTRWHVVRTVAAVGAVVAVAGALFIKETNTKDES